MQFRGVNSLVPVAKWHKKIQTELSRLENLYLAGKVVPKAGRLFLVGNFAFRTAEKIDVFSKSAALSYALVFALIPLLTTLLAFLTAFPGLQMERENFISLLSGYLLPGVVQDAESRLSEFSQQAAAAGALSSLTFFVVVLMLFQTMEVSLNGIWGVPKARSWSLRLRTLAYFLIIAALATTAFVVVRNEFTFFTQGLAGRVVRPTQAAIFRLFQGTMNLLVAWLLFVAAIKFLPNVKVRWAAAWLGGIVAGTAWHFLKSGFTWYVNDFANYGSIYGALGAVPIFFLWVYLSFLLLLVGACLAYAADCLKTSIFKMQAEGKDYPRGFYSVVVAGEIASAFQAGSLPLSAEEISERTKLPQFCVTDAISSLQACAVVLEVTGGAEPRFVLASPSETLNLWRIVDGVSGGALQLPREPLSTPQQERVARLFTEARNSSARQLSQQNLRALMVPEQPLVALL